MAYYHDMIYLYNSLVGSSIKLFFCSFFLFCFLLLLFFFFYIVTPQFATTPTSVNVTLGSTATFSCEVTNGSVTWQINGSLLSQLNARDISQNHVQYTYFLYVPATEEYNNTVVVCSAAIIVGEDVHSDPAVLRVQGMSRTCTKSRQLKTYISKL